MINFFSKKTKIAKEEGNIGVFEIEGLYTGYGLTLGNSLRRTLLSSLKGAAITTIKIQGVNHEFSTIPGIAEDIMRIILNIKKIRVKMMGEGESQTLSLSVKGVKEVKAGDISKNTNVEILNPELHIATLTDKKASLEMTLIVESGMGYEPAEVHKDKKLSIGMIRLDALFSPIVHVNCEVEDMRVGEKTNYNRLRIHIETDGSITPRLALKEATDILIAHLQVVGDLGIDEEEVVEEEKKPKKTKVTTKKK